MNNKDLIENTAERVKVIEMQKRELPPAYSSFFLNRKPRLLRDNPYSVDRIDSTEITVDENPKIQENDYETYRLCTLRR